MGLLQFVGRARYSYAKIPFTGRSKAALIVAISIFGIIFGGLLSGGKLAHASVDSGTTERVDLNYRWGGPPNIAGGREPSLSKSGRYIAFAAQAKNLVANDSNEGISDIFIRDRYFGETALVSLDSDGAQHKNWSVAPDLSSSGRYVVFASIDCFTLDPCRGNGRPSLVPEDHNELPDVFVRDLQSGTTELITVLADGTPKTSCKFRFYVSCWSKPAISGDGRYVAFDDIAEGYIANDSNRNWGVFVRDRELGASELVSVSSDGEQANEGGELSGNGSISSDGRYVVFQSAATNLVTDGANADVGLHVYLRDRVTRTTKLVDAGANDDSWSASVSDDGRYIAFTSNASNLVPNDTYDHDVFVRDMTIEPGDGAFMQVSVDSNGGQGENGEAYNEVISSSGKRVVFVSDFANLVPEDTNSVFDVFVHDLTTRTTIRASVRSNGAEGDDHSGGAATQVGRGNPPAISADGRVVAFNSSAKLSDPFGIDGLYTHVFHR